MYIVWYYKFKQYSLIKYYDFIKLSPLKLYHIDKKNWLFFSYKWNFSLSVLIIQKNAGMFLLTSFRAIRDISNRVRQRVSWLRAEDCYDVESHFTILILQILISSLDDHIWLCLLVRRRRLSEINCRMRKVKNRCNQVLLVLDYCQKWLNF